MTSSDSRESRKRIFLVDDHPLVREWLGHLINPLGGSSGIELVTEIKLAFPKIAVLVLSMHEDSTYVERALRAGALGYVAKRETTAKIVAAIRQVLRGQYFLSGPLALAITRKYVERPARVGLSPAERLSNRELEVFEMLGTELLREAILWDQRDNAKR